MSSHIPPPLPLDEQLCFALYATSMAINRAYKPALDQLGITYPQFLVLQAVQERESQGQQEQPQGRTIGQIAERLGLESSTITPLVKRMETAGLLERTRNPDDERQVNVSLTPVGRARWAATGCLAPLVMERCGMKPEALAALNAQVRALLGALNSGSQATHAPDAETPA